MNVLTLSSTIIKRLELGYFVFTSDYFT